MGSEPNANNSKGPHKQLSIRAVDGTVYLITGNAALDYVMHPQFLRFAVTMCVIYALAHGDADVPGVSGWPFLAIWGCILVVVLLWFGLCGYLVATLFKSGRVVQVWTPVLLFPMNLIIEFGVEYGMFWLVDQPLKPWGLTLSDFTRDLTVLLLMDFLHTKYVVPGHPYAQLLKPRSGEKPDVIADGSTDHPLKSVDTVPLVTSQPKLQLTTESANGVIPTRPSDRGAATVQIGTDVFVLTDIVMIRIEDHYLSITTQSGRSMQRAKLGAIEQLHNGDLGIQINRSVWVAFWAIRDVLPAANGQILLILFNGDEELVAKPRVYAFKHSYRLAVTGPERDPSV